MITGTLFQALPTGRQKQTISQWMGCSRFIWNAKCEEERYQSRFARCYLPDGTYPEVNQKYTQYKSRELSPWLFDCPSQILRNSASNWYSSYKSFLSGRCGKPKRKRKGGVGSIHLTRELFRFETDPTGLVRLFIGTKSNNIGYLRVKFHRDFKEPNSIWIKKTLGRYTVSFCYDDGCDDTQLPNLEEHLDHLRHFSKDELEQLTVGLDRGVKIPVQAGETSYDFSESQEKKKKGREKYIRRCQRRLARQKKGSGRRKRQCFRLGRAHQKIANIRKDFAHKTSRAIVDSSGIKVIVLEDLKTKSMTRSPSPKSSPDGKKWERNGKRSKAGLNRAILDKGWYQLECFLKYKAFRAGKAVFKVSAHHTSQECADCGHTHPNNRKSQALFHCEYCGHSDNADRNAAEVIKKRAINLILHSGTELSKRGVLLDIGRGAEGKTLGAFATRARGSEASKKKEKALVA